MGTRTVCLEGLRGNWIEPFVYLGANRRYSDIICGKENPEKKIWIYQSGVIGMLGSHLRESVRSKEK